jgi:hypothetical protein
MWSLCSSAKAFLVLGLLIPSVVTAAPASAESNSAAAVFRFPMVANFTDPCTGEDITFSGDVVFVVSQFTTGGGGNHLAVAQAWQDVSAVSASGTTYRVINTSTGMQQNPPPGGGPSSGTQEFMVISQTSLDNFVLHATSQTVDANGEVVVSNETFSTDCRG